MRASKKLASHLKPFTVKHYSKLVTGDANFLKLLFYSLTHAIELKSPYFTTLSLKEAYMLLFLRKNSFFATKLHH